MANIVLETALNSLNGLLYSLIVYFNLDYATFTRPESVAANFGVSREGGKRFSCGRKALGEMGGWMYTHTCMYILYHSHTKTNPHQHPSISTPPRPRQ